MFSNTNYFPGQPLQKAEVALSVEMISGEVTYHVRIRRFLPADPGLCNDNNSLCRYEFWKVTKKRFRVPQTAFVGTAGQV
jgi:hypothetical protein